MSDRKRNNMKRERRERYYSNGNSLKSASNSKFSFQEIPGEKNLVRGSTYNNGEKSSFTVFALSKDQFEKLSNLSASLENKI